MASALQNMLLAIDDEISALRTRRGASWMTLHGGERVGTSDGQTVYRFPLTEDLSLREDTPVKVTVNRREAHGYVVSVRDSVLVAALTEDLGARLAHATLAVDDAFLLEALRARLRAVDEGKYKPYHLPSANLTLGAGLRSGSTISPIPLDGLNTEQRVAVETALGSNATFVWGPPGTGKTQTLARLIKSPRGRLIPPALAVGRAARSPLCGRMWTEP